MSNWDVEFIQALEPDISGLKCKPLLTELSWTTLVDKIDLNKTKNVLPE